MNFFQLSNPLMKNQNKTEYTLDFFDKPIIKITIDTKTQSNPRYPIQTFEVYIESFSFDYSIALVNRDGSIMNIQSSNIKYLTFHSSSELNIHLINEILGKTKYTIKFDHSLLRNKQNDKGNSQPIFGFTIPYKKLFEKLNTQIETIPEDIINKIEHDNCLIAMKYGNININKSMYDYQVEIQNSKFLDEKKLSFVVCESCNAKFTNNNPDELQFIKNNYDITNDIIIEQQIQSINEMTNLDLNLEEITKFIGGKFLVTPLGFESKDNLPFPLPLFIIKLKIFIYLLL